MSRPTVHDVARVANVSLSTVDRVLNGRTGVRAATEERVRTAMKQLGYERDIMAANLSRKRNYNIHFVIPDGPNSFMRNLAAELETHAQVALRDRTEISVSLVPLLLSLRQCVPATMQARSTAPSRIPSCNFTNKVLERADMIMLTIGRGFVIRRTICLPLLWRREKPQPLGRL